MEALFFEIGLVIISAALVGVVGYFLRQPLVLAYIAAGILIGPSVLGLVQDVHVIEIIAEVGIMLMLFLVGLEMNPKRLKNLGWVALVAGVGQVLFTGGIGYLLALWFGFEALPALYLAIALAFSSTVIAVKLLYDKRDNNALYGQVTIGILLIQDVIAIIALLVLAGFKEGGGGVGLVEFGWLLGKGVLMVLGAVFIAGRLLSYLYNKIATSNELLILFSLAWAFGVALLASWLDFNIAIGAFVAGVSLASLPYTFEINAKAKILRDFFITIFFVALGAGMVFTSMGPLILPFIVLSLFVLIGNPLIILWLMGLLGYDKRTSFFTGLAVGNISEFSLILVTLGLSLGHLEVQTVAMVTLIAVLTMTISSYGMTYNNKIYNFLKPFLEKIAIKQSKKRPSSKKSGMQNHLILLGCGQVGSQILDQIKRFKNEYVVVDHDSNVIQDLLKKKVSCMFGDIEDVELVQELDLPSAEIIISTLPNPEDNLFLIKQIAKLPPKERPIVLVTANSGREGMDLFNRGADYVILKPYLGASHLKSINKELYELEEEVGLGAISEGIQTDEKGKFRSDQDYAQLLHNLNKLRLAEIKALLKGRRFSSAEMEAVPVQDQDISTRED